LEKITMLKRIFLIIFLALICCRESGQVLYCAEEPAQAVEFKSEGTRDPFVSAVPQKPVVYRSTDTTVMQGQVKPPNFLVEGMVWGSARPQAIIEDKIYNIGDEVKGAKIVSIDRDGIKVTFQGNIFLIAPETIKSSKDK